MELSESLSLVSYFIREQKGYGGEVISEQGNTDKLVLEFMRDVAVKKYLRTMSGAMQVSSYLCHTDNKGT